MLKFGFELEGFYSNDETFKDALTVPPKDYPTDGFPGLVEFRSKGPRTLLEAFGDIVSNMVNYPQVVTSVCEHTFSASERGELRRRHEVKSAWNIDNLYGKSPRSLGNKTIASLQINISNMLQDSRHEKEVFHPARYGLLDIPRIVRNLDEAFADEIREAKRQPGEYCVKDDVRLEYRSLPNFVFPTSAHFAKDFIDKIERCVK